MLSFLYVYSDHSILECYNLFSGVELSMRSFFVILDSIRQYFISCRDDNTRRERDSIGAHRNKNKIRRRLMRVSNYFLYIFDYFNKVMIAESCKRC